MTSQSSIISQYPLSRGYAEALAGKIGGAPSFVTLGELRQGGFSNMLAILSRMRGTATVALEDPTSSGTLPIMKLLSAFTGCRRLQVADHKLSVEPIGRIEQLGGLLKFIGTSIRNRLVVERSRRLLDELLSTPRDALEIDPSRKRVAYINTNLWFGQKAGGSVGHITGVANGFLDHGFDLDYLTVGGRLGIWPAARHSELQPPAVFGLPFEANYFQFDYDFEKQALDIIDPAQTAFLYQRLSIGNFSGVRLSRQLKIPLVVEYNGSEVWVANNWGSGLRYGKVAEMAELATLRHAHTVVTISDVLRDELVERGIAPERIACYPNCIDPAVFNPDRYDLSERSALRARLGLAEDASVSMFLGTFGAWHGAEVFAEAIRQLAVSRSSELRALKMQFLFVGDGLRLPAVRSILSDPACAEFVRFAGLVPQSEAPAYLAASDILVSPHVPNADGTRFFGSPTKLFEYLGMGKAIVASNLDQIGEVLRNSIRGAVQRDASEVRGSGNVAMLLPPGDAASLAEALVVLAGNAELRAALGKNARAEALAKYTWHRHVEEILTVARSREPRLS